MKRHTTALSFAAALALATTAYWAHADESHITEPFELAQSAPPPQGGSQGGPQGGLPPQEALDACEALSEADACSFSIDQTEITGTCLQPPQGPEDALICVPAVAGNG